jgi:ATP-dependent RNA helicase DDX60
VKPDFSLVLATVITSLTNFMKPSSASEVDMMDVMGSGDAHEEVEDEKSLAKTATQNDEGDGGDEDDSSTCEAGVDHEGGLPKVLKMFQALRDSFDEKFKLIWA